MMKRNGFRILSFLIIFAIVTSSLSGCGGKVLNLASKSNEEYKPNIYFTSYENTAKMMNLLHDTEVLNITNSAIDVENGIELRNHEYSLSEFKGLDESKIYEYFDTNKVYAYLLHDSVLTINNCGVELNTDGGPMDEVVFSVRTRVDNYEPYYDDAKRMADEIRTLSLDNKQSVEYLSQKIVDMVQYDQDSLTKFNNGDMSPWNIQGAFQNHAVVCEGYSKLFHLVCDMLDIPVLNVLSEDRGEGAHMWNTVYVDNAWTFVDVNSNDAEFVGDRAPTQQELNDAHTAYLFVPYDQPKDLRWNWQELNVVKDLQYPNLVGDRLAFLETNGLNIPTLKSAAMEEPATKLDVAILLANINKNEKFDKSKNFDDVPEWATGYVNYAIEKGYLKANGKHFGSDETALSKMEVCEALLKEKGATIGKDSGKDFILAAAKKNIMRPARCLDNTIEKSDIVTLLYDSWSMQKDDASALY